MATIKYSMDVDVRDALNSIKKFQKGLDKTDDSFDKVDKSSKTLGKSLLGLKSILAGLSIGGLLAVAKSSLQTADALGKVANKTGFAIQQLQELRYIADQAGISSNTLDTSLQRFSRRVGEAAKGTGVLNKNLKDLGISIKKDDGSMRNITDIFNDYINAMRNATSDQERLRLAVAAFDMEGANMVNMLGESEQAFRDMGAEASRIAPLLTKSQVESATKANDAWAKVKFQFSQIAKVVSAELAPGMEALATSISDIMANENAIKELKDSFKGISDALKTIADLLSNDLISLIFDVSKWAAMAFAVRAVSKALTIMRRSIDQLGTAIRNTKGKLKAGEEALNGARMAGAAFTTMLDRLAATTLWTILLGFLLDTKNSLVTLTGLFGDAEKAGGDFFDTLARKAKDFKESNAGVLELLASGVRGLVEGAQGKKMTDFLLGDFGKPVTIDVRKNAPGKKPGYVGISDEEIAAEKARSKALDEQEALRQFKADQASKKRRANFKLEIDLAKVMKDQMKEITDEYQKENEALLSTANALLPLKTNKESYIQTVKDLNEALSRGLITQNEFNKAMASASSTYLENIKELKGINKELEKQKQLNNDLKATVASYTPIITQQKRFKKTEEEINLALKKKLISQKEYNAAMANLNKEINEFNKQQLRNSRKWSDGWKRAMEDYVDNATNAAQEAERVFTKATQGMEDALVGFAKTGKFEWKSFLDSIVEEMLRSQIRKTFASLFGSFSSTISGTKLPQATTIPGTPQQQGGKSLASEIADVLIPNINPDCVKICPDSINLLANAINGTMANVAGALAGSTGGVNLNDYINGGGIGGGSSTSIFGSLGGWVDDIVTGIGDFFGGWFATGGMLPRNKWGIVGERGPEIISGPANVTPMSQGTTAITYNINAVDAMSFKQLVARDPQFIYAVTEEGRRGLPGYR